MNGDFFFRGVGEVTPVAHGCVYRLGVTETPVHLLYQGWESLDMTTNDLKLIYNVQPVATTIINSKCID